LSHVYWCQERKNVTERGNEGQKEKVKCVTEKLKNFTKEKGKGVIDRVKKKETDRN
jgi:hypothetical protein